MVALGVNLLFLGSFGVVSSLDGDLFLELPDFSLGFGVLVMGLQLLVLGLD